MHRSHVKVNASRSASQRFRLCKVPQVHNKIHLEGYAASTQSAPPPGQAIPRSTGNARCSKLAARNLP